MVSQKSQARSGPRSRQFSIVIHDVKSQAKAHFEKILPPLMLDWSLVAEEPYSHQDGSHIHIFLKYPHPQSKFRILQFIQKQNQGGRVQVDIGRGAFQDCKKYLTDPDKDKITDDNTTENVCKLTLIEKYPDQVSKCLDCSVKFYDPLLFGEVQASVWLGTFCKACFKHRRQKRQEDFLRTFGSET